MPARLEGNATPALRNAFLSNISATTIPASDEPDTSGDGSLLEATVVLACSTLVCTFFNSTVQCGGINVRVDLDQGKPGT